MIAVLDLARAEAVRENRRSARQLDRPVTTIGFFDGLHRGHQKILADLLSWSARVGGQPVVVTFDRQPRELFLADPPVTITTLEHRLLLLARSGIQGVLVLPFDRELASWSPEEFVERVLRKALDTRELLLGFDSAIGHRRAGTFDYLKAREKELGVHIRRSEPYLLEGIRVSSTLVREAVRAGHLSRLQSLLGRPLSILGEVIPGDRRGRQLGFPTANLLLPARALPPRGVYFARAEVLEPPLRDGADLEFSPDRGNLYPAIVNIGTRPTFEAPGRTLLVEAHLLDFHGDLYGSLLEIHLLRWHREERRFASPRELVEQIQVDIQAHRDFLAAEPLAE